MKKLTLVVSVFLVLSMLLSLISFAGGADLPEGSGTAQNGTQSGGSENNPSGSQNNSGPDGSQNNPSGSQNNSGSDGSQNNPGGCTCGASPCTCGGSLGSGAENVFAEFTAESDAASLILIEAETGTVLYEKNADAPLPPASVTKVMTMLLIMEAIDSGRITYEETVTVSEHAASMGGSQVFLEPGEQMSVSDLLKCVVVASANDACVALAEHISGSEESFVALMNKRAAELGMTHSCFENTNGLDDATVNHVLSARDIATVSRELIIKHPKILEYTSIWMDSIRGGEFGLTNTNRLIRFYPGATGLKTGSTSKAKFCISATAERDGTKLICVVMGASTRDSRNEIAKKLLDFGFANCAYENHCPSDPKEIEIIGGEEKTLPLTYECYRTVIDKSNKGKIKEEIVLPERVTAPVKAGDVIGTVKYTLGDKVIAEMPIKAEKDVGRIGFLTLLKKMFVELLY